MKVNVLTEIIRKVVREEIKKAIRSELKVSKKKSLKEDIVSDTSSYAQLMNEEVKPKPKTPTRRFTSNKALNDILNETVGGIPQDDTTQTQAKNIQTDYKNLMDKEMFGTNDMASILGRGEPNVAEQTVGNTGARPSKELAGVLNKDYSAVLKAMDKKAKEKRG